MGSAESQPEAIVRAQVGEPILAEGWFHVAADVQLSGSPVIDAFRLPIEWLVKRRAWKLPAHSYWVVTAQHLHIFELRFGSETRLRRTVGTWDRSEVSATRTPEPNSVQ